MLAKLKAWWRGAPPSLTPLDESEAEAESQLEQALADNEELSGELDAMTRAVGRLQAQMDDDEERHQVNMACLVAHAGGEVLIGQDLVKRVVEGGATVGWDSDGTNARVYLVLPSGDAEKGEADE